jgi:threonine aldolase
MVERLAEDHAHAQLLAQGLAQSPGIVIDPEAVKTNIVFFALADDVPLTAAAVIEQLQARAHIFLGDNGPRSFRAVTHYWIGREQVEEFLALLKEVVNG